MLNNKKNNFFSFFCVHLPNLPTHPTHNCTSTHPSTDSTIHFPFYFHPPTCIYLVYHFVHPKSLPSINRWIYPPTLINPSSIQSISTCLPPQLPSLLPSFPPSLLPSFPPSLPPSLPSLPSQIIHKALPWDHISSEIYILMVTNCS